MKYLPPLLTVPSVTIKIPSLCSATLIAFLRAAEFQSRLFFQINFYVFILSISLSSTARDSPPPEEALLQPLPDHLKNRMSSNFQGVYPLKTCEDSVMREGEQADLMSTCCAS